MAGNLAVIDKGRCKEFNEKIATKEEKSFMEMINKDFDFILDPDFDDYIVNTENRIDFMKEMMSKYEGHTELEKFEDSYDVKDIMESTKVVLDVKSTDDAFKVQINDDGEILLVLSVEMFVKQIKDMNEELKEGKDVRPCFNMFVKLFAEAVRNIVYDL